jgi:SsrA-binding protein
MSAKNESSGRLASNRKAFHEYHVQDRFEAGIELVGTEVKSIRSGQISLSGSYGRLDGNEVRLFNLNIPGYEFGNRNNHVPDRPRRLLLHRKQIEKLRGETEQKGFALIPLALYLKRGWVKVELGLCKGKSQVDKRDTLRKQSADREISRGLARHYRQSQSR